MRIHRPLALMAGLAVALAAIHTLTVLAARPLLAGDSCSTFLMRAGDGLLIGHNLDDYIEVPGLVFVNPRGLAKENISWDDLKAIGRGRSEPRLRWVAKYGSLTYNAMGREFPDGGVNEAGLYVGEMTLLGTKYPSGKLPRLYHNQWMQYLLDNFATVHEALASLSVALPDGHCQWHFFLTDRTGRAAVIEFVGGATKIYKGDTLPYPILCNDRYDLELADLRNYAGFGGTKPPDPRYEREDPRFRWAAVMLAASAPPSPPVDYAFSILKRLDLGNNKWALVLDTSARKMFFRTYKAGHVRFIDLAALDYSCGTGAKVLDIHADLAGDVTTQLVPATVELNERNVASFWSGADMGFLGNTFLKPKMVKRMGEYTRPFACTR